LKKAADLSESFKNLSEKGRKTRKTIFGFMDKKFQILSTLLLQLVKQIKTTMKLKKVGEIKRA